MTWVEHIRAKMAYNEWANDKVFAAAGALTDDQLNERRQGTSYGSLSKDLAHVARTQGLVAFRCCRHRLHSF